MQLQISLSSLTGPLRNAGQQKNHNLLMAEWAKVGSIEKLRNELKKLGENHAKEVKAIPKGVNRAKAVEAKNRQFKAKKDSIAKKIATIQASRKTKMSKDRLKTELRADRKVARKVITKRRRVGTAVGLVAGIGLGLMGV